MPSTTVLLVLTDNAKGKGGGFGTAQLNFCTNKLFIFDFGSIFDGYT